MFHVSVYVLSNVSNEKPYSFSFAGSFPMNESQSTSFVHDGVKLTEYNNQPFIVGDYQHNQVEFFHSSFQRWYSASRYKHQSRMFGYAAISRPRVVYFLGGCCSENWTSILTFQNDLWSKFGLLSQGKINFMAITYGTDVLVIGGTTKNSTM